MFIIVSWRRRVKLIGRNEPFWNLKDTYLEMQTLCIAVMTCILIIDILQCRIHFGTE
jgi:hypothetical protein